MNVAGDLYNVLLVVGYESGRALRATEETTGSKKSQRKRQMVFAPPTVFYTSISLTTCSRK